MFHGLRVFCREEFAPHGSPMDVARPRPPRFSHFAAFVVLLIAAVRGGCCCCSCCLFHSVQLLTTIVTVSRQGLSFSSYAVVFLLRMMFVQMLQLGVLQRRLRNMLQPIPRERSSLPEPQGLKRTAQLMRNDFGNRQWLGLVLIDQSDATL